MKVSLAVLCIGIILALFPPLLMSQTTGQISGTVSDIGTKEILLSANVTLVGTSLGASTDMNGQYLIRNVPLGSYTLRVSYIGYKSQEIRVKTTAGATIVHDFKMEAVAIQGQEVVITAQALGQNAAINRQLASDKIVNIVSAARIQELPDANAAESVGRLPGVYLLRSGGEGYEIAIRGLEPKYNMVMIDGVQMAATNSGDRSVDLSMISSSMLNGIEVYKTITPDMDAAVLGGVVNFQTREAKKTPSGEPEADLSMQGGYKYITSAYNPYKFSGSVGARFLDDRLGVLAQGVVEKANLTGDGQDVSYGLASQNFGVPNPLDFGSLTLTFNPRTRMRYDGSVILDYTLPEGKIAIKNFFSRSDTKTETRSQQYQTASSQLDFRAGYSPNRLNVITNLLHFNYNVLSFNMDAKASHSYSENINTGSWSMVFAQHAAGTGAINRRLSPQEIAQQVVPHINFDDMNWEGFNTSNSFMKQRDITGSIDLERNFSLADEFTATLKFGGEYRYKYRWYDSNAGSGSLISATVSDARAVILQKFPWMTQPPYNFIANGNSLLTIRPFLISDYSYGKFLNGVYAIGPGTNFTLISQALQSVVDYENGKSNPAYTPNVYSSGASDYSGNEHLSSGYFMATLRIGPDLTIIPGVRYQGLETSYLASRYYNVDAPNPYPNPLPHTDTTMTEYHGFWLPDVNVKYNPFSWLRILAAYTNTITYPDFSDIVPRIDVGSSVTWNRYGLKPARTQNFDLAVSVYSNYIGLFEVDGFLKRIDDLIFSQSTFITDPSLYPGLPAITKGYPLSTALNNPYRVDVWGAEVEWATHFWYLPGPLSGLVLTVNYTHIFSGAQYPYTLKRRGPPPFFTPVIVDTFYTARLVDQPNDIVNFSTGYDYRGFSARVSMMYQANVFTSPNFWPELRTYKAKYVRWDFSAKQELPWPGLSIFLDLNDLNNASDMYICPGNGYPTSQDYYGMTADVGLRWTF